MTVSMPKQGMEFNFYFIYVYSRLIGVFSILILIR